MYKLLTLICVYSSVVFIAQCVPTLEDRMLCGDGDTPPPNRVDSSAQVAAVREEMTASDIQAYLIPMGDQHQSEYTSEHDARVKFVSGFTGSAGKAVVVDDTLALWTDGRYFLQADEELDCNWILMKEGEPGVPSIAEWLIMVLEETDVVGANDQIMTYDQWTGIFSDLDEENLSLSPEPTIIDDAWTDQPLKPNEKLIIHPENYAGLSITQKVANVRMVMEQSQPGNAIQMSAFSALDETAWLLNLRGEDVPFNPVFFSYSIVYAAPNNVDVKVFIQDVPTLLEVEEIRQHLQVNANGECLDEITDFPCIEVLEYNDFYTTLKTDTDGLGTNELFWVSPMGGYALYNQNPAKTYLRPSLIRNMKGRKNPTELEHLKECYKKDSAALIRFLAFLEEEVQGGRVIGEIEASEILTTYREAVDTYHMLSFNTISGFGSNGAIIHYAPSPEMEKDITTEEMYLLDSGGQYLDGTTDVTRTMHYGTPTEEEKEAYTVVLQASIDLALTRWANGTYGRDIDAIARAPLWARGMDYKHGTGHGIGMYLHVHEGPGRINIGYRPSQYEEPLYGSMIFSDEPGFYMDGHFGVRLETVVYTELADTKYNFGGIDYLGFKELTLVPFEPNLINYDWLTSKQVEWLNYYNARCRQEIGDMLSEGDDQQAHDWLMARTQVIDGTQENSATAFGSSFISTLFLCFLAVFCKLL